MNFEKELKLQNFSVYLISQDSQIQFTIKYEHDNKVLNFF